MCARLETREWCESNGNIPRMESSAKENYNVDVAFHCVAKMALTHEHAPENEDDDIEFK